MKKVIILMMAIMFAGTATFAQTKKIHKVKHTKHTKYTKTNNSQARFTCTMHPEVVVNKPGKCPKCDMKLVPVKMNSSSANK